MMRVMRAPNIHKNAATTADTERANETKMTGKGKGTGTGTAKEKKTIADARIDVHTQAIETKTETETAGTGTGTGKEMHTAPFLRPRQRCLRMVVVVTAV
jgi:hypothetical protein